VKKVRKSTQKQRSVNANSLDAISFFKTLISRRSIRNFTKKKVPKRLIKKILFAAMCAPSARDEKPWHFIVIEDRKILDEIPKIHPHAEMFHSASFAILICLDPKLQVSDGYGPLDCANAAMNILLSAHGFGLGAVWVALYPREHRMQAISNLLKIPKEILPFAFIAIGYPAEKSSKKKFFMKERVHYNRW